MDQTILRPPRRVAGMSFADFVRVMTEAIYQRAFTAKLRREMSAHELRQLRVWQETVLNRSRLMNLEKGLARRPEMQDLIRSCRANLKRLSPASIPFPEPLWSRAGKGDGAELLSRTPTGARLDARLDRALAYLRKHPRTSASEAARRFRISAITLRRSPRYREVLLAHGPGDRRLLRWFRGGHNGGLERALAYLAAHPGRSQREIARAAGVNPSALSQSPRFRRAWKEQRRQR